jgi:hypothetical protein
MRTMLAAMYAVTTVVLAGCGSDSITTPTPLDNSVVVGTWNLTTVNGSALPYVLREEPRVELLSDRFVLLADGTFTATIAFRIVDGDADVVQSREDAGTYSFSGTVATFMFNDQTSGTAAVSGNTFTLGGADAPFIYTKQ